LVQGGGTSFGSEVAHGDAQAPQFSDEVARFWQLPEQFVRGNGHELVQLPWLQTCPLAQGWPHAPQLLVVVRSVSQPSEAI
jgi:hypothetical protein